MSDDWRNKPLTYQLRHLAEAWDETETWRTDACSFLHEAAEKIDRLTAENNRLNEAYSLALAELETLRD